MRGVGGPLLCIGDLLSDVGEGDPQAVSGGRPHNPPSNARPPHFDSHLVVSNPNALFQENYDELYKALTSEDKSWTSLTLKLCTALEAGKKLVEFGNTQVSLLSEKVEQLERITKQTDSAVAAAKAIQVSFEQISIDSEDK